MLIYNIYHQILVKSDGSGMGSDWFLQQIDVTNTTTGMKACYVYDGWMTKKDNTLEIELHPLGSDKIQRKDAGDPSATKADNDDIAGNSKTRYRITTHTSNIHDAGTDACVFVTFEGARAPQGAMGSMTQGDTLIVQSELNAKGRNNFERNETDSFIVYDDNDIDLGQLTRVVVEIKKGMWKPFSNWHLSYIVIEKASFAASSVDGAGTGGVSARRFACNEWLSSRAGWSKEWTKDGNGGTGLTPEEDMAFGGGGQNATPQKSTTSAQQADLDMSPDLGLDDGVFPEVEKEQSEFVITFYTGSKGFAGTDANVVIEVMNENGTLWTPLLLQKKVRAPVVCSAARVVRSYVCTALAYKFSWRAFTEFFSVFLHKPMCGIFLGVE